MVSLGTRVKNFFASTVLPNEWYQMSQAQKDATKAADDDPYQFGCHKLDSSNRFKYYQQMRDIDTYVNIGILELGFTIGKGFGIGTDDKADLTDDQKTKLIDAGTKFANTFKLHDKFADSGALLGQDGTNVIHVTTKGDGTTDTIEIAPMPFITLLTKDTQPYHVMPDKQTIRGYMVGEIGKICLNEGTDLLDVWTDMENNYVLRNFPSNYIVDDTIGRHTIGMYGRSLLDSIYDVVKFRQNLLYSYEKAVIRYGNMKLMYNYKVVGDMMNAGMITPAQAKILVDMLAKDVKDIKAGQEIVAAGVEVQEIEPTGTMEMIATKKSLEDDITKGLLGIPQGGSGGSGSNTFSSIYIFETRRMLLMESMRRQVKEVYESIIQKEMKAQNIEGAEYVRIKLDPIKEPDMTPADYMALWTQGLLNDQQLFDLMGISAKPQDAAFQKQKKQDAMDMQMQLATAKMSQGAPYGGDKSKQAQKESLRGNDKKNDSAPSKTG